MLHYSITVILIQQFLGGPSSSMGVRCSLRCLPIARSTLIYALDSAFPRRWPSPAPFAAFPSYALRWYLKRVKVTPAVYPRSAISGRRAGVSAQSHRWYLLDSTLPRRWPSSAPFACLPILRSLPIRSRLGPSSSMAVNCSLRCLPITRSLLIRSGLGPSM